MSTRPIPRRDEDKLFKQLVNSGWDVLCLIDATARIEFVSESVVRVLGYSSAEFVGLSGLSLVHPFDLPKATGAIAKGLTRPRERIEVELRFKHRDGSWRWLEIVGVNRLGEAGIQALVVHARDSTLRHEAEAASQANEARFRQLFAGSPDAIFVKDLEGNMLEVNEAACRLHGAARSELIGSNVLDLVPPEERETVARGFRDLTAGRIMRTEGFIRRQDGRTIPVELSATRLEYGGKPAIALHLRDVSERQQAQEALKSAEARQQLLLHQFPAILWSVDRDLRFTSSLGRGLSALGLKPNQVVGRTLQQFFGTEDTSFPPLRSHLQALAGEAVSYRTDFGGQFYDAHVEPIRDAQDAIIGVIGVALDITERAKAEESARHNIHFASRIAATSPLITYVFDLAEQRNVFANRRIEEQLGYSPEQISGMGDNFLPRLLHPEDLTRLPQLLQRWEQAEDHDVFSIEYRMRDAAGRWRWFQANDTVFQRDKAGKVCQIIGTAQDITERKQAEERIRRLAAFPQLNPNPVLEFAADGSLTYHNHAAEDMAAQAGLAHPRELLWPDVPLIVSECLVTGEACLRIERSLGPNVISWSFYPIEELNVVHCYLADVTERRQLEAQFRQSQKMESVGQLAAGVAHDFNNLLTIIQGNTSLLLELGKLDERSEKGLREIHAASTRAADLTRQLLLFSRKQRLDPQPVKLEELCANLTKMLGRILGEHITLELSHEAGLPAVLGDTGMLEQAILNLAVNARDAMPRGGRLHLNTTLITVSPAQAALNPHAQTGRFLRLMVTDSGSGISPEVLPKIFEPFFTTKDVGKGTGLGLATVYGIIRQHDGWIEVDSTPGEGSQFRIYLPTTATAGESKSPVGADPAPRGGHETILLAEDEPGVRTIVAAVLEMRGYRVLQAGNAAEAIAVWEQHRSAIKVLVTDMVMPGGTNGLELAERLRGQQPDLKVIFISGYSSDMLTHDQKLATGRDLLPKPFTPDQLLQAIRAQLDSQA